MKLVVVPGSGGDDSGGSTGRGGSRGRGDAWRSAGDRRIQARERCYEQQSLAYLSEWMCDFLARQGAMFVAVTGPWPAGDSDLTVLTGEPGFVRVLDEKRISWRPDGGPEIGDPNQTVELLFVELFRDVVRLHVTGSVTLDADGRAVLHVAEAYMRGARPIPRLLVRT